MSKLLSTSIFAVTFLASTIALAKTTSAQTFSYPVTFEPGDKINVSVINKTPSIVELQKIQGADPIPLRPGQEIQLNQGDGIEPNISLFFWDVTGLPLQALVSKPDARTLRVELRPGGRIEDRTIYILNDGRVRVF